MVLVASLAGSKADMTLPQIVEGFVKLLPVEDLQNWATEKYISDVDFQTLIKYLGSEHFRKIDDHVLDHQWQYDYLMWLESEGLEIIPTLNVIRSLLGLPEYHPPTVVSITSFEKPDIEWELMHLIEELNAIMEPHAEAIQEYVNSVKDEPKVKEVEARIKAEECREFAVDYVYPQTEVQELIELITEGNIPMQQILEAIANALWGSKLHLKH